MGDSGLSDDETTTTLVHRDTYSCMRIQPCNRALGHIRSTDLSPSRLRCQVSRKRAYTSQTLYNFGWDERKGRNSLDNRRHSRPPMPSHSFSAFAHRRSGPTKNVFRAFAPGGIGNLGPGIDILGCAVTGPWRRRRGDARRWQRAFESMRLVIPTCRRPGLHASGVAASEVLRRAPAHDRRRRAPRREGPSARRRPRGKRRLGDRRRRRGQRVARLAARQR